SPLSYTPLFYFFLLLPRPPRSPLFPYTTLFRSGRHTGHTDRAGSGPGESLHDTVLGCRRRQRSTGARRGTVLSKELLHLLDLDRSEEHTSELQSRGHLVCRLLLEKKKKK